MSALNRSMFKKQIVNREEGSPLEGEDSSGGVLQALLQSIKNLAKELFFVKVNLKHKMVLL